MAKASQDSPQLNGQSETKPAELSDKMDGWKPTMRQKDSSISMVKISNYGKILVLIPVNVNRGLWVWDGRDAFYDQKKCWM